MTNMSNPFAEDEVVYTITLADNREAITGTFLGMSRGPFWTLQTTEHDWIDVNPAHIATLTPATGDAYARHTKHYGTD